MPPEDRKSYQKQYKKEYAKSHRQVSLSVTNTEYRDFQALAKREKTKVSTLIRNMALAYSQQETLMPKAILEELADLKYLIRNIANNVNQMAHYSNTVHSLVEENEFVAEIQKLEKVVKDYTENRLKPDK